MLCLLQKSVKFLCSFVEGMTLCCFGEQFLLKISNIKLWMSRCDSVSVPCVVSKISRKKNWCHIRSGGYEAARTQN